jgi:signal transduction histidine kinase
MRDVMTETLSNLEDLIRIRGAQVTYGELPNVSGTPQLVQLLQNLIGNGIKYCEAEVPVNYVTALPVGGDLWQFSVKDNGIGIPEKNLQEVFEPFHRLRSEAKYEGTGLGLATCKKIVERHGGSISGRSEHGNGSTFLFTLHAA